MSLTLRLTADLTFALMARAIGARRDHPPILQLSADGILELASVSKTVDVQRTGSNSWPSPTVMLAKYRSPVIWIGGSEPLTYPGVARLANAIAASERHIFLETSGAALKPRLHEFQPSSRFYFAIRFDGRDPSSNQRAASITATRAGFEALRMAHLAGFFTCAHLVLQPYATPGELEKLHAEILKFDVDGFLITPAARTPELAEAAGRLRRNLLSRRWALLSSLLDSHPLPASVPASIDAESQPAPESRSNNFGESVKAG